MNFKNRKTTIKKKKKKKKKTTKERKEERSTNPPSFFNPISQVDRQTDKQKRERVIVGVSEQARD